MKKVILIALMLCFAFSQAQDGFKFEKDKQLHLGYSVPIAVPSYFLGSDILHSLNIDVIDNNRILRIGSGALIVAGVNTMKELTDIGKTGFNKYDIFYGTIGGIVGSTLTDLLFYDNWKNKKLERIEELERERISSLTDEERLLEEISKR